MRRDDRLVVRASRHLDTDETLLASAVGRELGGRRGRVVLVTSRRIIVAWSRPAHPEILSLVECKAEFEVMGRVLTLFDGQQVVSVRDVDPSDAGILVDCVEHHDVAPVRERLGEPSRVQIVED